MQYRIYVENDDGSYLSQGTVEAATPRAAIERYCEEFPLYDHDDGMIALAPGETLPAHEQLERKVSIDGIDYDFN